MPTADRGLSISGLTAQAGSFTLGPVSFGVPADRVLVAGSGAGKTVLLETIAGLRPQQSGQISLAGADITGLPPNGAASALSSKTPRSSLHMTVKENIRFGPRASGTASPAAPTAC